jgi:hypothetical protein
MQENIQEWFELDGDTGFQFMTEEETVAVIFFYLFSSALPTLLNCPFICLLDFLSFMTIFCFINQDYHLIQIREFTVQEKFPARNMVNLGSSFQ